MLLGNLVKFVIDVLRQVPMFVSVCTWVPCVTFECILIPTGMPIESHHRKRESMSIMTGRSKKALLVML